MESELKKEKNVCPTAVWLRQTGTPWLILRIWKLWGLRSGVERVRHTTC